MRVFCFFNFVPQLEPIEETKLILLWKKRWEEAGYTAEVLTEYHAAQHRGYEDFKKAVATLPSINPGDYDHACYLRWLAVAEVAKGDEVVAMTDYDVIPYGKPDLESYANGRKLVFLQKYIPALVIGTKKMFFNQAMKFAVYKYKPETVDGALEPKIIEGKPHTSDQNICAEQMVKGIHTFEPLNVMKSYTEAGWETAPFVHYNNGAMVPQGKTPRYQHIPHLR